MLVHPYTHTAMRSDVDRSLVRSQAAYVFARVALRAGHTDLLERHEIPRLEADSPPEIVLPLARLRAFTEELADVTRDPALGLRIGMEIPRGVYGLFEYVVRTAPTLRLACHRFVRYQRLLDQPIHFGLEEHRGYAELRHFIVGSTECISRQVNEFIVAFLVRYVRDSVRADDAVEAVSLAHRKPADTTLHEAFFRCPLTWSFHENRVRIPAKYLDTPMLVDDPELARVLEEQAEAMLARMPAHVRGDDPWLAKLREAIGVELRDGVPRASTLARRLHMSTRTLHRRLEGRGLSFHDQLDLVRRELADEWLRRTDRSLADIAFMLGFSQMSSFTRAYKRWTGTPPSSARPKPSTRPDA